MTYGKSLPTHGIFSAFSLSETPKLGLPITNAHGICLSYDLWGEQDD